MSSYKQKSFTLIEMLVTTAIIIILAAITFGVYSAYRNSARLDLAAQNLHDLIFSTRNMAFASGQNATNYIFFINVDPDNPRTPHAQSFIREADPHPNDCLHLEKNGGYCIQEETTTKSIPPSLGGVESGEMGMGGGWCLPDGFSRTNISRGKIDLSGGQISADEDILSGLQRSVGDCGTNMDCGNLGDSIPATTSTFCAHALSSGCNADVNQDCSRVNEDHIVKIHFRSWDGAIGINGLYNDVNYDLWDDKDLPEEASFTFTYGDKTKTLTINLYSGAIRIE